MNEVFLTRINDAQKRERVLEEFNASTLDDVDPLGGDQGVTVLKEMNELGEQQDQIIREGVPKIDVP